MRKTSAALPAYPLRARSAAAWSALLIALPALALADFGTATDDLARRYAATAPVSLVQQDGLQRLALPLAALQASRSPRWADVRVLDAQGRPVPTAWLPAGFDLPSGTGDGAADTAIPVPRFAWPAPPAAGVSTVGNDGLRVRVDSAGAVVRIESSAGKSHPPATATPPRVWLLDLTGLPRPGRPISQLVLDWPHRVEGFSATVQVEASDDARRWVPVASSPLLELPGLTPAASAGPSTASGDAAAPQVKQIDWPAGAATPRYLRLAFSQPLDLTASAVRLQSTPEPEVLSHETVKFQPVAADSQTPFHWALDLQGAVPVKQLRLALPQVNTVLGMRLEQRADDRQPWRTVSTFVAWRLMRDGREERSAPIEWNDTLQAQPARHWRLLPDTRTAQLPAEPLEATLGWRAPQLLFVAQGGGDLRLAVGRERDTDSTVDWRTLVPGADRALLARLPEARLGEFTARPATPAGVVEQLKESSAEDHRRWALWAVLGVAVVGLGGLAWRLGRDMRAGGEG